MLGYQRKTIQNECCNGTSSFALFKQNYFKRKQISDYYDSAALGLVQRPAKQEGLDYNYAYYPVVFKSETELLKVFKALNKENIYPRRYFYPSLNNLPYIEDAKSCPTSEDISSRIACFTAISDLEEKRL